MHPLRAKLRGATSAAAVLRCWLCLVSVILVRRSIGLQANSNPQLISPSAVEKDFNPSKEPCKLGETWQFSANDVSKPPPQSANLSRPLIRD